MTLNGFLPVFLCGAFGGLMGELLKWYRLRELNKLPQYIRSPFYWLITLLIIFCGGILTTLYGTKDVNSILAVNIGLSAPLIIHSLSKSLIKQGEFKPNIESLDKQNTDDLSEFLELQKKTTIKEFLTV